MNDTNNKCTYSFGFGFGAMIMIFVIFYHWHQAFNNQRQLHDTNAYLRKSIKQVDSLLEQIDKRPTGLKAQKEIETNAWQAFEISYNAFEQLKILYTGKLQTSLFALITPNFLTNEASTQFDGFNDKTLEYLEKVSNYTQDNLDDFKKRLPKRTDSSTEIEKACLALIESYWHPICEEEMARRIVWENDEKIPKDLENQVHSRMNSIPLKRYTAITAEIKAGRIQNTARMVDFLCGEWEWLKQKGLKPIILCPN